MKFSAWSNEDGSVITMLPGTDPPLESASYDIHLLYTIEADTWEDAMKLHHEYQGWNAYKPMT